MKERLGVTKKSRRRRHWRQAAAGGNFFVITTLSKKAVKNILPPPPPPPDNVILGASLRLAPSITLSISGEGGGGVGQNFVRLFFDNVVITKHFQKFPPVAGFS